MERQRRRGRAAARWIGVLGVVLFGIGCEPAPRDERALSIRRAGLQFPTVLTEELRVPHLSTVPANVDDAVELFVKEVYPAQRSSRAAVLMVHGRSVPALAGFELQEPHYDWAAWLAHAGAFDVFILDFQGSGRSPRPKMDDPCNAPLAQQTALLVPNPLAATCSAAYPHLLNTIETDLAELDTVVDYIRAQRGVDKVHLVSWSQGSWRVGPYAARHGDKVASLFLYAPIFNKDFTVPPAVPSTPMTLTSRAALFGSWRPEVKCDGQREDGIEDAVWGAIMAEDAVGATWGPVIETPDGPAPEGVMRVRNVLLSPGSWNASVAREIRVPTAIIQGQFDTGTGARQDLAQLYDLIPHPNKLRFRVECAGHFMVWEKQRSVLHHVSKEWIANGEVGGFTHGQFFIDTEGDLGPCLPSEKDVNRCLVER